MLSIHPEIEKLRSRLLQLRSELRETMDDWHRLSTEVRPRLHAQYHQHFGELERELQYTALRSAELFRRVELLSIKVSRGEVLTEHIINLINQVVDSEYARFAMRIREAFDLDVEQRERAATSRQDDAHNGELVNMYRTLAKQLHPDSARDASADSLAVWHRVQQAYSAKNVSQMKSLLSMMGAEDVLRSEATEWDLERWQLEVERLETRLRVEHRKLRKLRSEEPFTMEHVIDDEQWQIRHRRELEQAIASKQHEIRENTSRYAELTGGSVPPGTELVKTKDEQSFEEDFLKNTYFGRR
jgi:hypothetical protein